MRILFDSRNPEYKAPFGTLTAGETCRLALDIPCSVCASRVSVVLEDGCTDEKAAFPLYRETVRGDYVRFSGAFTMETGLYFYHFQIEKQDGGSFRLFRQGRDTNMEAGDCWQLTFRARGIHVPQWARGAVIYQIFPDRFFRSGDCDLTGKLEPYTVHEHWGEQPDWRPNGNGEITNSDFFGGTLQGIREKLPYLRTLGVTMLYLNPIFFAWSNHRYDTADYLRIDPMLGTEADFSALCRDAHRSGMKVILDGVFSHTGSRSRYFQSAVSDPDSPYRSWYQFRHYPDSYESWWGITTLPCLNKQEPAYLDYLIRNEDSVVAHWLRAGADGWRLDVVDELPDELVLALKRRIREVKPDALLLGEVWEDASNKIAYGRRRRYFLGGELDAVMNYPLKNALLAYLTGKDDGSALGETLWTLLENYPQDVLQCCMNLLGSHDTARILTALTGGGNGTREEEAARPPLPPDVRRAAVSRLRVASLLQFALPGAPSIYYGDEAGMEGGKDPFNRACFPWDEEDAALLRHFRALGALRQEHPALRTGSVALLEAGGGRFGFSRGGTLCCFANLSADPWEVGRGEPLLGLSFDLTGDAVTVQSGGAVLLRRL